MALQTDRRDWAGSRADAAQIDAGLRQYMLRVYNYMASGLALTGLVALVFANTPALLNLLYVQTARGPAPTILGWVVLVAPVLLVFVGRDPNGTTRASTVQTVYWIYTALIGAGLSWIFMAYTGVSIARTFFVTAASFGALSLYGYTTGRDLSAMGRFLVMGFFGLIIAMLVNAFVASQTLDFVVSAAGVLIFAGLTAYYTQAIKQMYWAGDASEVMAKKAINGAWVLYAAFINLFLFLLRFMGDRRQ